VITGAAVDQRSSSSSSSSADAAGSGSSKSEDEVWVQALKPQPVRVQEARLPVLPLHEAQLATCGAKAHACAKLEELSIASTFAGTCPSSLSCLLSLLSAAPVSLSISSLKAHACAKLEEPSIASTFAGADFSVPRFAVITFGVMDASNRRTLFHRLVATLNTFLFLTPLPLSPAFPGADFSVPRSAVITFGVMEEAITASNRRTLFHRLVATLDDPNLQGSVLDSTCAQIRTLLEESPLPPAFFRTLSYIFSANARLIVRSSANVEDLAGMSGAGLYDSVPDVTLSDPASFGRAVASVWASLFTRRAVLSRRAAGVRQSDAAMAVLVQELISPPDLSFVLHTKGIGTGAGGALVVPSPRLANSSSGSGSGSNGKATGSASTSAVAPGSSAPSDFLSAEVAPGLGETLASGTRGTAWRFAVGKSDGSVRILAFANFSEKIVMAPVAAGGGSGGRNTGAGSGGGGGVVMQAVDYSGQLLLSTSPDAQVVLAKKLEAVGAFLEDRFGSPQDIEGCVVVTPPIVTTAASSAAAAAMAAGGSSAVTIASSWFTLCTAAVIPLYTLMIFAPDWHVTEKIMSSSLPSILLAFTEKIMSSSLPSILLGFVYLYLLYKSWTPNTLLYMFSSKYWLPEYWLPEVRLYQSPLYELLNSSRASHAAPSAARCFTCSPQTTGCPSGHHSDLAGITLMFASTLTCRLCLDSHLRTTHAFPFPLLLLPSPPSALVFPTPASGHHSDVRQHAHCRPPPGSTCWPLISLPPGELSGGLSGESSCGLSGKMLGPVRHVYLDGLKEKLETRHSLVLCLMLRPLILLIPSSHSSPTGTCIWTD
ncbi:unnamed protein product, partial [Closterium sp. NIES-64]